MSSSKLIFIIQLFIPVIIKYSYFVSIYLILIVRMLASLVSVSLLCIVSHIWFWVRICRNTFGLIGFLAVRPVKEPYLCPVKEPEQCTIYYSKDDCNHRVSADQCPYMCGLCQNGITTAHAIDGDYH